MRNTNRVKENSIMTTPGLFESANALKACGSGNTTHSPSSDNKKAPPAITGDNVYVAWWTNKTGNDESYVQSFHGHRQDVW